MPNRDAQAIEGPSWVACPTVNLTPTMSSALIIARVLFGALTLTAIVIQFTRHFSAGFPLLNFFSYFTILSNGIAGAVLLIGAYLGMQKRVLPLWYDRARGTAVLYMTIVGLVFVTLLRNVDLGGLLPWINTVHHYVLPVVMVADWLLVPPMRPPTSRDLLAFYVFPLAYVLYTLLRGAMMDWYPYPFLNPSLVGGYGTVMLYGLGMLTTFGVVGWALRAATFRGARGRT